MKINELFSLIMYPFTLSRLPEELKRLIKNVRNVFGLLGKTLYRGTLDYFKTINK